MNWNQDLQQELYGWHATRAANQILANCSGLRSEKRDVLLLSSQTTAITFMLTDWLTDWDPWCYLHPSVCVWLRYFDWGDTARLSSVQLHLQFKPDLERLEGSLCWLIISEQNNNKLTGELQPTLGKGEGRQLYQWQGGSTPGTKVAGRSTCVVQFSPGGTFYQHQIWSGPALSILQAENDDGEITQPLLEPDFRTTNTAIETTVNTVNSLTSEDWGLIVDNVK